MVEVPESADRRMIDFSKHIRHGPAGRESVVSLQDQRSATFLGKRREAAQRVYDGKEGVLMRLPRYGVSTENTNQRTANVGCDVKVGSSFIHGQVAFIRIGETRRGTKAADR